MRLPIMQSARCFPEYGRDSCCNMVLTDKTSPPFNYMYLQKRRTWFDGFLASIVSATRSAHECTGNTLVINNATGTNVISQLKHHVRDETKNTCASTCSRARPLNNSQPCISSSTVLWKKNSISHFTLTNTAPVSSFLHCWMGASLSLSLSYKRYFVNVLILRATR